MAHPELKIFSSKTTSHKGQVEVCLLVSRLLSGHYQMWSSMKMTLKMCVIHPSLKHYFEKVPFLDPHYFRLTKTFFDDTYFGGSDEPP